MAKLFAEALNEVLYAPRIAPKLTVEDLHSMSGVSKWTIHKWTKDENTEGINAADHLSRMLDEEGDSRLVEPRLSAHSSLIQLIPTTIDGCIQREKDAIIDALSKVIQSFPTSRACGEQACQQGINAFMALMEEFKRL